MSDSAPPHSVNCRWSLTIIACIILGWQSGCLIAAWPAPEVGSGQEIEFRDYYTRNLIEEDGLLIVHREYDVGSPWMVFRGAPLNHVVEIAGGTARIPREWAIWSCWITPGFNPFPTGGWIRPENNLMLIPLVPGYLVNSRRYHGNTVRLSDVGRPWDWCLSHLRRRHEKRPYDPDLRLPDDEYFRVKRFIAAELRRLERTRDRALRATRNPDEG